MAVMVYKGAMQLKKVAELIHARLVGNGDVEIEGVSSIESASAGDLIFVEGNENLPRALKSPASAVLVGDFGATDTSKPLLVSTQPRLAFARAARHLAPTSDHRYAIHPSAVVHPSARLAKEVQVDERVVIGQGVEIGSGTSIGAGSVIGANVIVNTGATVDHECVIEDGVHIGPGVHIGGKARIGKGAWIGIGSTLTDRAAIGAGTIIGAGAVVVRDIPANVVAYGVPAKVIRNL